MKPLNDFFINMCLKHIKKISNISKKCFHVVVYKRFCEILTKCFTKIYATGHILMSFNLEVRNVINMFYQHYNFFMIFII